MPFPIAGVALTKLYCLQKEAPNKGRCVILTYMYTFAVFHLENNLGGGENGKKKKKKRQFNLLL